MANYKVEDLSFYYPNSPAPALDGVSFDVREGEFLLLIGPSGCGKSTLLRHLKTVLAPHGKREGRVYFNGRPLEEAPQREQAGAIGFVFQHPEDQIVTDKVWHELAFGLESLGAEQSVIRLRVSEMASYFGLEELFYRSVEELSGGQKQLLNLASVMAMNPKALILDEPTSQLDPVAASEFLSTVKKLNTELGMTVILSEHRLEEAMPLADRVLVLDGGRLICCAEPKAAAKELISAGSGISLALPSAARIGAAMGMETLPLTVNEGRRAVQGLGLEPRLLPEAAYRAPEGKPALEAKEIYFRYEKNGADVLKAASLAIYPGEILALVGGNGAGKTTLLSVLSGCLVPYRGSVCCAGVRKKGRFSAFEERIAFLRQDPRTLFSAETVAEELHRTASNRSAENIEQRVAEAARLMDIGELFERHPFDLSGGEQQRAAIAKVLLTEPDVLLLDEPTKGLDAGMKAVLGQKLLALKESGLAILIVSHDTEFCAEYADRAGFMFDGAVTAENSSRGFFCENTFYTTAANRIARDICRNALLTNEVIGLVNGSGR